MGKKLFSCLITQFLVYLQNHDIALVDRGSFKEIDPNQMFKMRDDFVKSSDTIK